MGLRPRQGRRPRHPRKGQRPLDPIAQSPILPSVMTGITRYIFRQLVLGVLFVSLGLACVLWLTQSLRYVELIVTKGVSAGAFFTLTGLLLPGLLSVVVPLSVFGVTLFTYNRLNADRELVVMRSIGLSHWALARPALLAGGGAVILGYVLSLWAVPQSVRTFREMQWSIRNDVGGMLLQEGTFSKLDRNLTVYIRERDINGDLLGILIHDSRNKEKTITMMAERGTMIFTDGTPRVLMSNGSRQSLLRNTGELSVLYFDSYTLDITPNKDQSKDQSGDVREFSMNQLLSADTAKLGEEGYRRARVELHQRLTGPLGALGMPMIALALFLPAAFNRRGQLILILQIVGLMVVVQAMGLGIVNLASSRPLFLPLMYVIALLPLIAGAWALFDWRFFRRSRSALSSSE